MPLDGTAISSRDAFGGSTSPEEIAAVPAFGAGVALVVAFASGVVAVTGPAEVALIATGRIGALELRAGSAETDDESETVPFAPCDDGPDIMLSPSPRLVIVLGLDSEYEDFRLVIFLEVTDAFCSARILISSSQTNAIPATTIKIAA
jgi:hypothetical protein